MATTTAHPAGFAGLCELTAEIAEARAVDEGAPWCQVHGRVSVAIDGHCGDCLLPAPDRRRFR